MKKFIAITSAAVLALAGIVMPLSPAIAKSTPACVTIQKGGLVDSTSSPITLGYDQWGYNYQAHMFNGWYDNYSRPATVATGGDQLMMKWNDAWLSNQDCNNDGKLDRPTDKGGSYIGSGAWLTNHASGTYDGNWDVTGHYVWTVLGTYTHDLNLVQDADGNITGTGSYPAGALTPDTTEVITGKVEGNTITITTVYDGPYNPGYTATATGTIASDGTISGTVPWGWTFDGAAQKTVCEWTDFVKIVAVPSTAVKGGDMWYTDVTHTTEIGPAIWGDFAIIQEESTNPCGADLQLLNYKSELRSGLGNW